jgi:hypothetical protein
MTPDKSPRTPSLAGPVETLNRATCTEPNSLICGSSRPTVELPDVYSDRRFAAEPDAQYEMIVPRVESGTHLANVLSLQLGGNAPTGIADLTLFDPDPEQPTWIGSDPKLRTSRMDRARQEGPKSFNRPNGHQHVHQNGRGHS